ncbi:MAG: hypothetical protein JWM28_1509 [Chitinophagaceae bacterium]|nr:hypothetical protein [Chitinophagaceae bacterium]
MKLKLLLTVLPLLAYVSSFTQQQLRAVRTTHAPKIDGSLDDKSWQDMPVATNFIQNFPDYGKPSFLKTEVKIIYDDNAIYIGAYLYDDPSLIRKQLTARDEELHKDVDYFAVFLDTYHDRQNGFQFVVTSMNVQSDAKLAPNQELEAGEYGDKTWDAVWESKVSIQRDGWIVEMRIPYISLRFSKKETQDWGLQLMRSERRLNETSFWNEVKPNENGFINQFGDLQNLQNVKPPLRLSLSPYISGGYRTTPQAVGYQTTWLRNGGMDLKYGINESFTFDATVIPDFGQVISDNVINNLTPYEIKFQDNRPFFTEGTELFNKAGLFYSRRVAAIPSGYYDVQQMVAADNNLEVVKNPSVTQLLNAIKFSGRTKKKLGIGFFNAVTRPVHAFIRNKTTGEESRIETSPFSNYNILVLDQALKGRSYITFTNTSVIRDADARDANVSGLDLALYDRKNMFTLNAKGRYSKIFGTDKYDGFNTYLRFGKVSGKWQFYVLNNVESEKYDPTDLGYLEAPNEVTYQGNVSYNQFTPTKTFLTHSYSFDVRAMYLSEPYAFNRFDLTGTAFGVFRNFWDVTLTAILTPLKEHNYFELRTPGKYLEYPLNYIFELTGSTDSRKRAFVNYDLIWAQAPQTKNNYYRASLGVRYRFNNRFMLDLSVARDYEENQLGYAFIREPNDEPIVGFRNNLAVTSVFSGIYNFTSRINLTLRARHYWNEVHYKSFYDVDDKGLLIGRAFISNHDENINIFNVDAFFTWDFRLGSRMILGWKNWLGDNEYVDGTRYGSFYKNFQQTLNLRHANEVTLKFIYFLDYNQFRKKR